MSVKKYRVYCNDESAFVTGWSETEPTVCFNNIAHAIDTNQTAIVDIQQPSEVRIAQTYDDPLEGDSYFLFTNEFTVEPNSTTNLPIEIDVDSNVFIVHIYTKMESIGDCWSSYINKDTVIGVVGETTTGIEIKMAEASVAEVKPGFYLSFDGGATHTRVVSKTVDTVTMKESVSVTAGDVVMMTYFMVYNKNIIVAGKEVLGGSIIGSFRILKEYTAGIAYTNNSSSSKKVIVEVEMTF